MRVQVLGAIELTNGDGVPVSVGGPRQRRILAALVMDRGAVVSIGRLDWLGGRQLRLRSRRDPQRPLYKAECVRGPDGPEVWADVDELELATFAWVHSVERGPPAWPLRRYPPAEFESACQSELENQTPEFP